MASRVALPREGHPEQAHYVFGRFMQHRNTELVFDPSTPDIGMRDFERQDWSEFRHLFEWDEEPERSTNLSAPRNVGLTTHGKAECCYQKKQGRIYSLLK